MHAAILKSTSLLELRRGTRLGSHNHSSPLSVLIHPRLHFRQTHRPPPPSPPSQVSSSSQAGRIPWVAAVVVSCDAVRAVPRCCLSKLKCWGGPLIKLHREPFIWLIVSAWDLISLARGPPKHCRPFRC